VNKQRLIHFRDIFIVTSLVVVCITCLCSRLVKSRGWTLIKVNSLNSIGFLIISCYYSGSRESFWKLFIVVKISLVTFVSKLIHVVENSVCPYNSESYIDVQKTSTLFHNQSSIKSWPNFDIMSVKTMRISRVKWLLADCLKAKSSHHWVKEDL
jgi:hypothetical protein